MTLEEFKNKKVKLEDDIAKLLEQFEEETKSIITDICLSGDFYRTLEGLQKTAIHVDIKAET